MIKGVEGELYPCKIEIFNKTYIKVEEEQWKKWTKETAQAYIKKAKEKGLTYWSAVDYLKNHKTMHSII